MSGLDYERVVLAAGPLGLMQAALDLVLPYVHERKQFGQPIGTFQLVQAKIADMYVGMNAAKAYVYAVAKACDRGRTTREDAAGAILYAAELATKIALEAIQLLGRQRLHQRLPGRAAAARRQALRDRRRHLGNPPHADRPRAVRQDGVSASPGERQDWVTCHPGRARSAEPGSSARIGTSFCKRSRVSLMLARDDIASY